jgi:5'-nucleotidase
VFASVLVLVPACSNDDDNDASTSTTANDTSSSATEAPTTTAAAEPLHILVTNDDGIGAPGIDALVTALADLPDTEITVVAPAENQSGSSDAVTDGELTTESATTASGFEGTAVAGEPADTIVWAIEQGNVAERPDLVISGINAGQNIGPLAAVSGTVGAARRAARLGIPAVAASQGLIQDEAGELVADYDAGVEAVLAWLADNRDDLAAAEPSEEPALVTKIEIPTCSESGESPDPPLEVPLATDDQGVDAFAVDCTAEPDDTNDVLAFVSGSIAVTELPVEELDALITDMAGD